MVIRQIISIKKLEFFAPFLKEIKNSGFFSIENEIFSEYRFVLVCLTFLFYYLAIFVAFIFHSGVYYF